MKHFLITAGVLALAALSLSAQDQNERFYNYEVLTPQRNNSRIVPKPKVEGWADRRVKENLDRGLVAVKLDKGVYVGWRLLETDDPATAFNVYRSSNGGKTFRISTANNAPANKYIQSAKLNGAPLDTPFFDHETLMQGGTLEFTLTDKPTEWGIGE